MKYEKKMETVNAVQITSVQSAGEVLDECPLVMGAEISWYTTDTGNYRCASFVIWDGESTTSIDAIEHEFVVWDDERVWIQGADEFLERHKPVNPLYFTAGSTTIRG